MSEQIKLRNETERQVRALLISAPTGLSVREVLKDFRNVIGYELPYRKLGYTTPELYFKAMPDVVQFNWINGYMILTGVSTDKDAHIQTLVSRQRLPARKSHMLPGGRLSLSLKQKQVSPPKSKLRPATKVTVPANVRTRIKELLVAYPGGLTSSNFNTAFQRRFGTSLSYQNLGFQSVVQFLHALDGVIDVEEMKGGGFRLFLKKTLNSKVSFAPAGIEIEDSEEEILNVPGNLAVPLSPTDAVVENYDDIREQVPLEIKQDIKRVISRRPHGMWAARLPVEFKNLTRKELPFRDLGFNSVIEMVAAIPDVVTIKRPTKGDWMLFDAELEKASIEKQKTAEPESAMVKNNSVKDDTNAQTCTQHCNETLRKIDDMFKERLRQVLEANAEGVLLTKFQDVYTLLTGDEIQVQEFGFSSLDELLLASGVVRLEYRGQGRLFLFSTDIGRIPRKDLLLPPTMQNQEWFHSTDKTQTNIRSDAVGPGAAYKEKKLPKPNMFYDAFVSNIYSPHKFWLQFKGVNTTLALEELMDRLDELYNSPENDEYPLPDSLVTIGQVCVAIFPEDDNWHRVQITGIPNLNFVQVYFVDYGNTCCVPKSSLRMIKNRFMKLPAQAVEAQLYGIIPPNEKGWSRDAKSRFHALSAYKPLVALICGVQGRELAVHLSDTSTDVDIFINDTLVNEGLAQFIGMNATSQYDCAAEFQNNIQTSLTAADYAALQWNFSTNIPSSTAFPNLSTVEFPMTMPPATNVSNNATFPTYERFYAQEPSFCSDDLCKQMEKASVKSPPRFIKQVQLTAEHYLHIINHDGKPYITSGELSSFLWFADLIRSMLRNKRMDVPKVVLSDEDSPDLFAEFQNFKVKGVSDEGKVKLHLTMYELKSVPDILTAFDCQIDQLPQAIQDQIDLFDPDDLYWKGEDVAPSFSNAVSDPADDGDLEKMKNRMSELHNERQKILNALLADSDTVSVDELKVVDSQLAELKKSISNMQNYADYTNSQQVTSVPESQPSVNMGSSKPSPKTNVVPPMTNAISSQSEANAMMASVASTPAWQAMYNHSGVSNMTPEQQQQYQWYMMNTGMFQNPAVFQTPQAAMFPNPQMSLYQGALQMQQMGQPPLFHGMGYGQAQGHLLGQGRGHNRGSLNNVPGAIQNRWSQQ